DIGHGDGCREFGRVAVPIGGRGADDLTGRGDRERDCEAKLLPGVGRELGFAQVDLAFAVAGRVGRVAAEEFNGEAAAVSAVQRAGDCRTAAGGPGRGQHGEVLEVVGATVAERVVARHPASRVVSAGKVDAEPAVVVDRVGRDADVRVRRNPDAGAVV